jgi:tetratricopeptide (TPR) repeat protein
VNDFTHIDIPGIKIDKQLGIGGMARVFLASQTQFGRRVAVKFVSPPSPDDAPLRERFLAEARINAQLTHTNIVQVYDFGTTGAGLYLVMEYLPGGDLTSRLRGGLHIEALLEVIKDMGRALDFAHSRGIIHRDIKPENILFRDDHTAVLTDFGIAQVVSHDNTPAGRPGTVVGTPEYMSPEQAAGRTLDGRSDLYSLGIVLYRMLTGDVPFNADTAVAVGVKHLQDPIPRLPNYLTGFQGIIDTALAKRPEHRYRSGKELAKALDGVRSSAAMPQVTINTQAITTQEILAVGRDLLSTQRDPGRLERHATRNRKRKTLRNGLTAMVFIGGLTAAGYYAADQGYVVVDDIAQRLGIDETPELTAAWSEAQSLRQDPNQGLAAIVASYQRVLLLDDSHEGAITAVADLAMDWKGIINDALDGGNVDLAATRLSEAELSFPQDPDLTDLSIRVQNLQRAERLYQTTSALLASEGISNLSAATSAILTYQDVLRLAPGHDGAAVALNELAINYAQLAGIALANGDVNEAMNMLERATAADDSLAELENVRLLITQATESRAAIDDMLQQARRFRADNQLILPGGENAAELYHRVLATDPANAVAEQGLDEITAQVLANANELLSTSNIEQVEILASQAAIVGLASDAVNDLRKRIDAEKARLSSVALVMADALALMQQGFLTTPANANAVTRLRELQQLDPGNMRADELLKACADRLKMVATEAYQFGLLGAAKQYLDLALAITPDVGSWVALRESWEAEADVASPEDTIERETEGGVEDADQPEADTVGQSDLRANGDS